MEHVDALLTQLGLTKTEINLYRTGLSYRSIGVKELQKQTNIKRPTIYHALGTLMQKGLVAKKSTGQRHVFQMSSPEVLRKLVDQKISVLEEKKETLDSLLPLFAGNQLGNDHDTVVEHYEGIEGMKHVVEAALYCRSRSWDILAPRENFFSEFDKEYAMYFLKTRKARGIVTRSLWEPGLPIGRRLSEEEIEQRQPRYLPEVMHGRFQSVVTLFDDAIAVISSYKNLNAILIRSEEMHKTMSALFEGLWSMSTPYKEYLEKQGK